MKKLIPLLILLGACGKRETIYMNEPDATRTQEATFVAPFCQAPDGSEIRCVNKTQPYGVCGDVIVVGGESALLILRSHNEDEVGAIPIPNGSYKRTLEDGTDCFFEVQNYDTY